MKVKKIDSETYASIVSEKASGLPGHFERLRDGSRPTARSPLYKDLSEQQVRTRWLAHLTSLKASHPRLYEYEMTRWDKFGPQGGYPALDDREEDLEKYFLPRESPSVFTQPYYAEVVQKVRTRLFGNHRKLRAFTVQEVLNRDIDEDKVLSNSGLPDYSKRSNPAVQSRAVEDALSGKWKEYPAVLGSRSSRQKPRFIFMFPMSTNLVEKRFVLAIMDAIRANKVPSFSAWEGFDDVERSLHHQNAFAARQCISMDYSSMDTTVRSSNMKIVYDIVAPVFQEKFRDELKESMMHACEIPIMISEDKLLIGEHGLASGSGWTNLSESILSEFVHELIHMEIQLIGNQLLGDDGAMTTESSRDPEDIASIIEAKSRLCGFDANPSKQRINDYNLVYLQRFFDKDWKLDQIVVGAYPTVLALNAAMNPERFHDPLKWSSSMEILRWIMILENCKHHPMFHDLIDFFARGDKYQLGLAIPGYFKRVLPQDYKVAKTIKDFIPSYNVASKNRRIEEFEVVKYLKRKGSLESKASQNETPAEE